MDVGEVIGGYRLLTDFTTAGGGLSRWAFAERRGTQYFIKEFLAPKYPTDDAPGSPAAKQRRRERCAQFEQHQRALKDAVASASGRGGNLVATIDFFRSGSKYYKVTERIDASGLDVKDIARLSMDQRVLIMKTVSHSLNVLHQLGIVHGDLKPANLLIKRTGTGDYVAKLIDFDSSYFTGRPPLEREEIVGDIAYYSPEVARYIAGDMRVQPADLQLASDMFSLGLIFSQYLTGHMPRFDAAYRYACDAVNNGAVLSMGDATPVPLAGIVNRMLSVDPAARPTAKGAFESLKNWDRAAAAPTEEVERPASSRLSGSLVKGSRPPAPAAPRADAADRPGPATGSSRLRGSLLDKKK